jgi:hypothetical protein
VLAVIPPGVRHRKKYINFGHNTISLILNFEGRNYKGSRSADSKGVKWKLLCLKINLGAQCHSYNEFDTQNRYNSRALNSMFDNKLPDTEFQGLTFG